MSNRQDIEDAFKESETWRTLTIQSLHGDPNDPRAALGSPTDVYAISGAGLIKIGYAQRVRQRLSNLQLGSPVILEIVDTISLPTLFHARKVEAVLHRELIDYHSHGEWFENPDVVLEKFRTAKEIIALQSKEASWFRFTG